MFTRSHDDRLDPRARPRLAIRSLSTVAAVAALLCSTSVPLVAQLSAPVSRLSAGDTTRVLAIADSAAATVVGTAPSSAARRTKPSRLPAVFYVGTAAAIGLSALLHVDPDTGGYDDGWRTRGSFPDKAVHAGAAWALTSIGVDLGVRPVHSGLLVCAAGAAFEVTQGYVSPFDIVADCIGASGAALWHGWRARSRAKRAAPK